MIGLAVLFVGLLISLVDGYVLAKLWNWFVVPFAHAPVMSAATAMGIATMIGLLCKSYYMSQENKIGNLPKDEQPKAFANKLFTSVVFTLVMWGEGAIAHAWLQ